MAQTVLRTRLTCSFCGRRRELARPDPRGPAICGDCLDAATELVAEAPIPPPRGAVTPRALAAELERHVVGQDHARRVLSVALHNHLKRSGRVPVPPGLQPLDAGKSNVLLTGPTGSGKTLLVQTLARFVDVPLHRADATALTQAGYVGEGVESLVEGLLRAAGNDLEAAEGGIVFLDEVDKLATRPDALAGRDVGGEGVQQALLRLLEGTKLRVRLPGHEGRAPVLFDTSRVLFVLAGAFEGLTELATRRQRRRGIGFGSGAAPGPVEAGPQDLHRFGLLPELVGRLPVVTHLEALDEDALVSVLIRPRNALVRQYRRLLRMDGVDLRFAPGALRAIARRAHERGVGARGLRGELERLLLPLMFELPSRDDVDVAVITEATVSAGAPARLLTRAQARVLDSGATFGACGSP